MSRNIEALAEPDRLAGVPHPREQAAFFGHPEGEGAFVEGIRSGRLHHAWLIGGPHGIGKATLAYRVARSLLALASRPGATLQDLTVATSAPAFRQVAALSHPNLAVLRRAPATDKKPAASTISVDAVRRALSVFESTAADGGFRICIVDSAEDLTVASANALLKVIEEPPPRSVFLIVSHAPQRLLPTIRSRCRRLLLRPLADDDIRAVVESLGPPWSQAAEDLLDRAIAFAEGSARRALEMLDEERVAFVSGINSTLDGLPKLEPKRILALADSLSRRDGDVDYDLALDTVQRWLARHLHRHAALGASRLAPLVEVCDKLDRQAREIDVYNLDRRPLVLTLFDDLAEAVRRTA